MTNLSINDRTEQPMEERYENLLEYVKANRRACPQPSQWNALWEMLPGRRRLGDGWEPALPLILGAWYDTPTMLKHLRFLEHLEWARTHECLDAVDQDLRRLHESDWCHFGD